MNFQKILTNWLYTFLFFWLLLAVLFTLVYIFGIIFLDGEITSRLILKSSIWITFFSFLTASVLSGIHRYSRWYTKKKGKPPLIINNSNWLLQGLKIGLFAASLVFGIEAAIKKEITQSTFYLAAPMVLLGLWSAYIAKSRDADKNE